MYCTKCNQGPLGLVHKCPVKPPKPNRKAVAFLLGFTAIVVGVLAFASTARAWETDAMNKRVEQTNFVVRGACSGTLISLKYRLILTNHHCVSDFIRTRTKERVKDGVVKKVRVVEYRDVPVEQRAYKNFRRVGKTEYLAVIVAHKQEKDLALLQIRAENLPYTEESPILPKGKEVKRGDIVYAVGNPLGVLDASVTVGIISSVNRMFKVNWADGADVPFYQFSAGIAPGNSGGALYDNEGHLIGVPAAGVGFATHLNLAIPLPLIREFVKNNCYGDLFDKDAESHALCESKKKAKSSEKKSTSNSPKLYKGKMNPAFACQKWLHDPKRYVQCVNGDKSRVDAIRELFK